METKDILHELRTKKGLSQDELAEKLFVTRQAVSRWENGNTTPNVETLKLLSGLFDVSINTLLGSPRQLICQCCGMPLDDTTTSREPDGSFNEDYCKWCYTDGAFTYQSMDVLSSTVWKRSAGMICIALIIAASVLGDIFLFSSDGFCKGRVARKIDSVGIFPVKRLYMVAPSE